MKGRRSEYYYRPTYWAWIKSEATLIKTDGCSGVTGVHIECCYEHDLSFRTGKDPHDAYRKERTGSFHPWAEATPITFDEANKRFRQCHRNRSKFGNYSPIAWMRWMGVQWLPRSQKAWEKHRARVQENAHL